MSTQSQYPMLYSDNKTTGGYTQAVDTPVKLGRATLRAVKDFIVKPKEYTLINSTENDIAFEWWARKIVVPGTKNYAPKHPKFLAGDNNYADVVHSAQRKDGSYIPGTLVVKDLYSDGDFGARILVWPAVQAIQEKLGIDPETGEYRGAVALKGLSVLPEEYDEETIEEVVEEGRQRYLLWREEQAKTTLMEYESANAKRKEAGLAMSIPPRYVEEEAAFLKALAEKRGRDLGELLGEKRKEQAANYDFAIGAMQKAGIISATPLAPQNPPDKFELMKAMMEMAKDPEARELLAAMMSGKEVAPKVATPEPPADVEVVTVPTSTTTETATSTSSPSIKLPSKK